MVGSGIAKNGISVGELHCFLKAVQSPTLLEAAVAKKAKMNGKTKTRCLLGPG